jgi:GNAT superfamily N-acetyltransferase
LLILSTIWQALLSEPTFLLKGYQVVRLTLADAPELQDLYERCTDYHEAHEGVPTRPGAGEEELCAGPPGRSLEDKLPFGIYSMGGELIGYLELFRNYPAEGEWWIGLLMLDPKVRGQGLGGEIYQSARTWAAEQGAHSILLGVLEEEHAAERFWQRQGFSELRRDPYPPAAGGRSRKLVVLRSASAAGKSA